MNRLEIARRISVLTYLAIAPLGLTACAPTTAYAPGRSLCDEVDKTVSFKGRVVRGNTFENQMTLELDQNNDGEPDIKILTDVDAIEIVKNNPQIQGSGTVMSPDPDCVIQAQHISSE
ncbi:hypothetical protein A2690_01305 [Candidatus Roizmanbacteria bacterium RIFCSPHIGHO2_01_FULL_39_12b]|uniref:Uncharacterized protein n=1 Tax=Candidatus Roizmanbacteria bacterium RIFCSPHIGHO2_01_FULL_39_12b TaxID=1802030 RepID=A0A1F7GAX2_9BACT|nr:MAG: hypothetical protein A2690_01305 [Candidatus Roizmanbacteria bacterium RIFCSPHIGHO2_01_FULL_39_12b]OGK46079.1 MAG: hypothetical protein A3B46_01210 [Candidatus Roizmanbacteria bacterium RIFCSPLOWO2_01_FULL_39_19]